MLALRRRGRRRETSLRMPSINFLTWIRAGGLNASLKEVSSLSCQREETGDRDDCADQVSAGIDTGIKISVGIILSWKVSKERRS